MKNVFLTHRKKYANI